MKILLGGVGIPPIWSAKAEFETLAAQDVHRRHQLVEDPVDADLILFTECHNLHDDWRLGTVARSPLARWFPEKVFVYDERDRPLCRFPGLYVSASRQALIGPYQAAWIYPPQRMISYDLTTLPGYETVDLLFSFVGSPTHPCREALFELRHPDAIVERAEGFLFAERAGNRFGAQRDRFVELLSRSAFVLCPRGHGTSSVRLLETMAAGRVPVIISDSWVPPEGPEWDQFAVRWSEHDARGLVSYLEELSAEAPAMGAKAGSAFQNWFGPGDYFHNLVERLEVLRSIRAELARPRTNLWALGHAYQAAYRARVESKARRLIDGAVRRGSS